MQREKKKMWGKNIIKISYALIRIICDAAAENSKKKTSLNHFKTVRPCSIIMRQQRLNE